MRTSANEGENKSANESENMRENASERSELPRRAAFSACLFSFLLPPITCNEKGK